MNLDVVEWDGEAQKVGEPNEIYSALDDEHLGITEMCLRARTKRFTEKRDVIGFVLETTDGGARVRAHGVIKTSSPPA